MSSTWIDLKATYYLGKILGLFPFDGKHKFISFLFSLFVWLIFGAVSLYLSTITYDYTNDFSSKYKMLIYVKYLYLIIM